MIYLVAKILLLLLLAALFGAWLARWWVRRHYEDVTSEYAALGKDWQAWRKAWELKLAERPAVDLSGVTRRFDTLEAAVRAIVIPAPVATDLRPLQTRLEALELALKGIVIPTPVATDLGPLQARLDALELALKGIVIPTPMATDLGPLQARLDGVVTAIAAIGARPMLSLDLAPTNSRLAAVESAIREIVVPPAVNVDLSPILQKLDALESQSVPRTAPPAAVSGGVAGPLIREGSRNLLAHAAFGKPDDLKLITGVKTVMEKMLHQIGVYYFWQIAEWTPADIVHADAQLTAFHGRIERDAWVEQATAFAAHPSSASKPQSVG